MESKPSTMTVSKAMEGTCVVATMNSSHYSRQVLQAGLLSSPDKELARASVYATGLMRRSVASALINLLSKPLTSKYKHDGCPMLMRLRRRTRVPTNRFTIGNR